LKASDFTVEVTRCIYLLFFLLLAILRCVGKNRQP